jgi:hypothetical protein
MPPGAAKVRNTATWQFSTLPAVPLYCLCTPALDAPFLREDHQSRQRPESRPGHSDAPPHSRARHRGRRPHPSRPATKGAASRPGWHPPHARRCSSNSPAAGPPASPARTPVPAAAAPPCGTGPRPGASDHRRCPATGRGLRCGQRPPPDCHVSSQTMIIKRWPSNVQPSNAADHDLLLEYQRPRVSVTSDHGVTATSSPARSRWAQPSTRDARQAAGSGPPCHPGCAPSGVRSRLRPGIPGCHGRSHLRHGLDVVALFIGRRRCVAWSTGEPENGAASPATP